jgi:Protein of unknown function (DUF3501)
MKSVRRDELLDFETYSETRDETRARMLELKAQRRVHLGKHLTFLFENRETVRYQVQEMMRAERIVREADILHELQTYNELLGGEGELGATLLIEIDEAAQRPTLLAQWRDLPRHLYAELPGGEKVRARFDERQVGDDRLSSVQYLKFVTGSTAPVALGSDLPALTERVELTPAQRTALQGDLDAP